MRNVKSQLQPNRAFWRLDLTIGMSREFKSWANCLATLQVLSCSAIAGMNLQLPLHASHVCHSGDLPVVRLPWIAHFLRFFTLSHIHPLHYSHLNTRFLHAELQANLAWNKANTWLNKLNLTCTFHIPKLSLNLLFVGQLRELGIDLLFTKHGVDVQDPRMGQVLGIGHKVSLMFKVHDLKIPSQVVSTVATIATHHLIYGMLILVIHLYFFFSC